MNGFCERGRDGSDIEGLHLDAGDNQSYLTLSSLTFYNASVEWNSFITLRSHSHLHLQYPGCQFVHYSIGLLRSKQSHVRILMAASNHACKSLESPCHISFFMFVVISPLNYLSITYEEEFCRNLSDEHYETVEERYPHLSWLGGIRE